VRFEEANLDVVESVRSGRLQDPRRRVASERSAQKSAWRDLLRIGHDLAAPLALSTTGRRRRRVAAVTQRC
jgi:hypothetical protein